MKLFCPNCNRLEEGTKCILCGSKRLREVEQDDFCFLIEERVMYAEMLKGMLDAEQIPCAAQPAGRGYRTAFAMHLENLRLYVPYHLLDKANALINQTDFEEQE